MGKRRGEVRSTDRDHAHMIGTIIRGPITRCQGEIPGTWCFVQSNPQRMSIRPKTLNSRCNMIIPMKAIVTCVCMAGAPSMNLLETE